MWGPKQANPFLLFFGFVLFFFVVLMFLLIFEFFVCSVVFCFCRCGCKRPTRPTPLQQTWFPEGFGGILGEMFGKGQPKNKINKT